MTSVLALALACADATRRLAAGLLHHRKRPVDPGTLRLPAHLGSKQRSGAQRLGEDQAIAHAHPGLAQHAIWIDRAVDGETQRQLGAFAAVSADQHCARLLQHIEAAAQHLVELLLDLVLRPVGDGCGRQCGQRLGAHRVDVAQRMIGGNAAEEVWVVNQCAKEIDGLHEQLALRWRDHRGIVGHAEADLHAWIAARLEACHHARQPRGPDLGAAASAAHRLGLQSAERIIGSRRRRRRQSHLRQLLVYCASSVGRSSPSNARESRPEPPNARARRRRSGPRSRSGTGTCAAARTARPPRQPARGADCPPTAALA